MPATAKDRVSIKMNIELDFSGDSDTVAELERALEILPRVRQKDQLHAAKAILDFAVRLEDKKRST